MRSIRARSLTAAWLAIGWLPAQTPPAGVEYVTAIRHWSQEGSTRVAIEVTAPVQFRWQRADNPPRILVDLPETRLKLEGKGLITIPVGDARVLRIRAALNQARMARVVLDLTAAAEYDVRQLSSPFRVLLEVRAAPAAVISSKPPPSGATTAAEASKKSQRTVSETARPELSKSAANADPLPNRAAPAKPPELRASSAAVKNPERVVPAAKPPKPALPGPSDPLPSPAATSAAGIPIEMRAAEPPAPRPAPAASLESRDVSAPSRPAPAASLETRDVSAPSRPAPAASLETRDASAPSRPADDKAYGVGETGAALRVEAKPPSSASSPDLAPKPPESKAAAVVEPALEKPPTPALAPPKPASRLSSGERNMIRTLGLKLGRVVIDPGHGGHDQGTAGPTGLLEKELVLDVAQRLGALIEQRLGSEVLYTRTTDVFVQLEERAAFANQHRADLFVSVHANSSPLKYISGAETYYLNFSNVKADLEVAARENASTRKSIFELQELLQKIVLKDKIGESREFAGRVQRELAGAWSKMNERARNRGVKKAPFVVLIGASMPSILAEIGFVSNARDEASMKNPEQRQRIAEALFRGLSQYAAGLSQTQVAQRVKP